MSFYLKSGVLSLVLGLTAVMVIYCVGLGSYDSTVCRGQYSYSAERPGCRLLGFPTAYVENDTWGHNAHVYPSALLLNLLFWSAVCFTALGLVRTHLKAAFKALSDTDTATRIALTLELLAVPLVVLILVNDLPIRLGPRADLSDMFFGPVTRWTAVYLPLPTLALLGCLLGMAGVYRQRRKASREFPADASSRRQVLVTNLVPALPFFMAAWIVIGMIFVGWIAEVV
jgi:hypothetical protein